MASRENLVPVSTVDRNGRATTVYRKPVTAGSSVSRLPAPGEPREDIRRAFVKSLSQDFETGIMSAKKLRRALSGYQIDLLERLYLANIKNEPGLGMVKMSIALGKPSETVSEHLHFFKRLYYLSYELASGRVESLHHYRQLPDSADYSMESDAVKEQCDALLDVTETCTYFHLGVFRDGTPAFVLKDDRLVDLVVGHSDKVRIITDYIAERRNVHPEVIALLLEGDAPAMGNGRL